MAYTLYLYKEFVSRTNVTLRLEIFERDYSGSAIEIDSLSSTPVQLVTDNMNNDLATNYIKTHLLINIVDTEQIDYTRLFTSDATKFKVVFKIAGVVEWTGYLVPDSFYQPLTYRNTIQLTARDNLGMLSEFTYLESGLGTISSIIEDALAKISFACTLEYRIKKTDENGTNIRLGLVNKDYLYGKNYDEVLSILLSGMGCQMRFVGGNKYAIFDLADLSGYGASVTAQEFIFTGQSGNLELVPAWKDIIVSQDYGLIDPIFQQRPTQEQLVFSAYKNVYTDYYYGGTPVPPYITLPTYTPNGSGWSGTLGVYSPYEFGEDKNTILLPKMTKEQAESNVSLPPYIQFTKEVPAYDGGIKISFQVHNMLMMPDYEAYTLGKLALTDKSPILGVKTSGVGIIIAYNVFLDSGGVTYRLSDTWQTYTGQAVANNFLVDEPYKDENKYQNGSDIGLEVNILSLKSGGTLRVQLYGYYIWSTVVDDIYFDRIVRIRDFKFQVITNESGGLESRAINDDNYNIRGNINLNLGQVPTGKLGYLSMGGGIYQNISPLYPPMAGFKRTGEDSVHLSEQIGREVLHLRKQQRTSLNGTIQKSTRGILDFGKPFSYNSKTYALNYGSIDYASEQMQVELIEVEPYEYEDYTFVEATIDGGGGSSLGSGTTEFIQWSAAGNAKRIYELDTASEADQGGAYVVIDKSGLTAAKKVPISSLLVDAYTKTESDSRFASIDGDLTQDFSAKKLTTATLLLPQSAPTLASGEAAIYSLDSGFSGETPSGAGSVTSIALTMPTGFSVSGSPITESGTFGVTFASGYFLPTTTQFASKLDVSLKGSANGLAELDENGFVKNTQLPSYVDDVIEVDNFASLPATGETGKIYVTKDDNKTWRWGGSTYVQMYAGIALGETSATAYRGDRGKIAYDHTFLTNNPHSVTATQVGAALLNGSLTEIFSAKHFNISNFTAFGTATTPIYNPVVQSQVYPNFAIQSGNSGKSDAATYLKFIVNSRAADNTPIAALTLAPDYAIFNSSIEATKAKFTTLLLPQSPPTLSSGEMAIYGLESGFSGELPSGAGSVTSISMVVPTGLSVTPTTITESGTFTIGYASGYQMMTATESSKLAGIEANANNYSLPTATDNVLGGVKIGSNITITDGVISVATPYSLPTATASVLGGVKIGSGVTITDGVISVSTDYLATNGKAADSDKLDGHDSTYFAKVGGDSTQSFSASTLSVASDTTISGDLVVKIGATESGRIYFGASVGGSISYNGSVFSINKPLGVASITSTGDIISSGDLLIKLSGGEAGNLYFGASASAVLNYNGTRFTLNKVLSIPENINTNLRIPKVAPTSPTSGEYYFYIVE